MDWTLAEKREAFFGRTPEEKKQFFLFLERLFRDFIRKGAVFADFADWIRKGPQQWDDSLLELYHSYLKDVIQHFHRYINYRFSPPPPLYTRVVLTPCFDALHLRLESKIPGFRLISPSHAVVSLVKETFDSCFDRLQSCSHVDFLFVGNELAETSEFFLENMMCVSLSRASLASLTNFIYMLVVGSMSSLTSLTISKSYLGIYPQGQNGVSQGITVLISAVQSLLGLIEFDISHLHLGLSGKSLPALGDALGSSNIEILDLSSNHLGCDAEHGPELQQFADCFPKMKNLGKLVLSRNFSDSQTSIGPIFRSIAASQFLRVLHLERIQFTPMLVPDVGLFRLILGGHLEELSLNSSSLCVENKNDEKEFFDIVRNSTLEILRLDSFFYDGCKSPQDDLRLLFNVAQMRYLKSFDFGNTHAMMSNKDPCDLLSDPEITPDDLLRDGDMTEKDIFHLAFDEGFTTLEELFMDHPEERPSLRRRVESFSKMIRRRSDAERRARCFLRCWDILALPPGTIAVLTSESTGSTEDVTTGFGVHIGALPPDLMKIAFQQAANLFDEERDSLKREATSDPESDEPEQKRARKN